MIICAKHISRPAFRRRAHGRGISQAHGPKDYGTQSSQLFHQLGRDAEFHGSCSLERVSQLSTRAIRRLEDERRAADYRDGKNSRLTGLGHDVEAEFRRMVVAMKERTQSPEHWAMGGTACWMSPSRPPSDQRNLRRSSRAHWRRCHPSKPLHSLQSNEDTEVFSGKYHDASCRVKQDRNASGCASSISGALCRLANHPFGCQRDRARRRPARVSFVDRLKCEFRDRSSINFARRDLLMRPRSDRGDV